MFDKTKLVKDIKKQIDSWENPCDICRQDNPLDHENNPDYCDGCGRENLPLGENLRTYQYGPAWHTENWADFAFNDIGCDLSPADYGIVEYYDDEISDEEQDEITVLIDNHCEKQNMSYTIEEKTARFAVEILLKKTPDGGNMRVSSVEVVETVADDARTNFYNSDRLMMVWPCESFSTASKLAEKWRSYKK